MQQGWVAAGVAFSGGFLVMLLRLQCGFGDIQPCFTDAETLNNPIMPAVHALGQALLHVMGSWGGLTCMFRLACFCRQRHSPVGWSTSDAGLSLCTVHHITGLRTEV